MKVVDVLEYRHFRHAQFVCQVVQCRRRAMPLDPLRNQFMDAQLVGGERSRRVRFAVLSLA